MQTVEKLREVAKDLLSLDEIRLCKELQKLVKDIPDEKKRLLQIDKLWQVYIANHPREGEWAGNAKASIIMGHMLWENTLRAQDRSAEDLLVMIQNYIKQTEISPLPRMLVDGNIQWIYKGYIYKVNGQYSVSQQQLLIQEAFDRERAYWEKLEQKYTRGEETTKDARPRIPESVRSEVWRRDDGKCARCGSRENLEYDHIIPLSRGGSNTSRNIELLCEKCNRQKGANIE